VTETASSSIPQIASLIHSVEQAAAFPLLDRIGDRFGRALKELIGECGFPAAEVLDAQCSAMPYADFTSGKAGPAAICRYRLNPTKGAALMLIPAPLVRHLVNGYFGGGGDPGRPRENFSNGEMRFVSWLADRCGALQAAAWTDIATITPELDCVAGDWSEVEFLRGTDTVIAQVFNISCGMASEAGITLLYPSDTLNTLAKRDKNTIQSEADSVDAVWQGNLANAVLHTRLPLRAIFARPNLPISKLLALKVGDVIPVVLPNRVPVVVAGRRFAEASVGEANGRIAIQILKMEGSQA
jgi:flagellar motor switch protein FliM